MEATVELPEPTQRNVAVRVTPDALRWIRAGHPWVYESSITSISHDAAPGDLAVLFDRHRDFCGIGLWDPTAPIRVRVLHAGRPTPIDDDWWFARVAAALGRRAALAAAPETTAYRLVHGENDGLPGLVVDAYGPHLVAKIDTPAVVAHLRPILAALGTLIDPPPESVVLRTSRSVQRGDLAGLRDGIDLVGETPERVGFTENGLCFVADLRHGQKTGWFLDQRDNRARLRDRSEGRRVLDVFCHSGGFGVHAAAGGAGEVRFVDRSAPALAEARAAMELNRDRTARARAGYTRGDAFETLEELRRRRSTWDIVVIDPPSFARRHDDVDRAVVAYRRLTRAGLAVLAPGGLLVQASCSSRIDSATLTGAVTDEARTVGRPLRDLDVTGQPADHPVGFDEGAYLSAVWGVAP